MTVHQVTRERPTIKSIVRGIINPVRSWLSRDVRTIASDSQLLLGKMASWHVRSLDIISSLHDIEFKVTSQWGEDGIIDWLIERAKIPASSQTFIEFGVGSYREANTRFLLQNRNWRGFIMDGSREMVDAAIEDGLAWKHDLNARQAFITRENINDLISSSGMTGEIGLLSIDLDGNDYWVWEAIDCVRPIICICEYNALFGDVHPISVLYDPTFFRTHSHYSNMHFGASITALRSLAVKKGYKFVGTTGVGNDAFFVREDYARRFVDTSLLDIQALPCVARNSSNEAGELAYVGALERSELIKSKTVVNTETGETIEFGKLEPLYSKEWLARMMGAT